MYAILLFMVSLPYKRHDYFLLLKKKSLSKKKESYPLVTKLRRKFNKLTFVDRRKGQLTLPKLVV